MNIFLKWRRWNLKLKLQLLERFQDLATPGSVLLANDVDSDNGLGAFNTAMTIIKEVASTWSSSYQFILKIINFGF